jgi:hypothetical protein
MTQDTKKSAEKKPPKPDKDFRPDFEHLLRTLAKDWGPVTSGNESPGINAALGNSPRNSGNLLMS